MAEVIGTKRWRLSMALIHAVNTRNPSKHAYYGLFIYEQSVVPHIRSLASCPCHEAFLFGRV